ncbi:hypothetical protein BV96_03345 [Sphingomonas paucimobilis]|nr:hypothetical protein BV96_03345 [Sphingomonas paucimobilis]
MNLTSIQLRRQNFMLAVRREMGWPLFKPANDAIIFCAGRPMDFDAGMELARVVQTLRKDAVYSGWASAATVEPDGFTIVHRQMLTVDVFDRCVPFAADEAAPIIFVSTRGGEQFSVDARGSLARIAGKPKGIGRGRKLALKRIRATAAQMDDVLLADNMWVPTGGEIVEPVRLVETVVQFA